MNFLCMPNAEVFSFRSFMTIIHALLIYISFQKFIAALVSNISTRSALCINNKGLKKILKAISLQFNLVFQQMQGGQLRIQDIYASLACILITNVSWGIRRRKDVEQEL